LFGPSTHHRLRQAPGEAEAELAYLNRINVIDGILSDDVDNFLFGARVVIRKCGKFFLVSGPYILTPFWSPVPAAA
jgi:XPG I-region